MSAAAQARTRAILAADYLGLDINESCLAYARRRYRRRFLTTDVCRYTGEGDGRFDFILINSFLHHVEDAEAVDILRRLAAARSTGIRAHTRPRASG